MCTNLPVLVIKINHLVSCSALHLQVLNSSPLTFPAHRDKDPRPNSMNLQVYSSPQVRYMSRFPRPSQKPTSFLPWKKESLHTQKQQDHHNPSSMANSNKHHAMRSADPQSLHAPHSACSYNNTPPPIPNHHNTTSPILARPSPRFPQTDGPTNYKPTQQPLTSDTQPTAALPNSGTSNAALLLLQHCTHPPLSKEQAIDLSDVAGSLKEVVLLALRAGAGDAVSGGVLTSAVGQDAAEGIVDFFRVEWIADGV